jgi:hypothetical protein
MRFANKRGWKFLSERKFYVTLVVFSGCSNGKLGAEALLLLVWSDVLRILLFNVPK